MLHEIRENSPSPSTSTTSSQDTVLSPTLSISPKTTNPFKHSEKSAFKRVTTESIINSSNDSLLNSKLADINLGLNPMYLSTSLPLNLSGLQQNTLLNLSSLLLPYQSSSSSSLNQLNLSVPLQKLQPNLFQNISIF